ncbi:hypothetical protein [Modestobacter roseus]|uniref:Uncharacterized protein n=1 Tax=Modestobacter roseus TaxID=1181884 RepID=A0A562IWL7_9ACTN|nr:hypothetical protein [Modestobacter roseus]MQA34886.1 hypothetical protein [Modestobacter roseus]TWH75230.1 hypothetical protein JD78_03785 [Modestobacter roseus]
MEDAGQRAYFAIDVRMLPTEQGGRRTPAGPRYRPQLDLGERSASGEAVQWDCEWVMDDALGPGESTVVYLRLFGLSDEALRSGQHLDFFEGRQLVATGEVVTVVRAGEPLPPTVETACRACGFDEGDHRWVGGSPQYVICPGCGVESGVGDVG